MSNGVLKIATCQFAVGGSVKRNGKNICAFLHKAKDAGADIVHFSECALSGYAGTDIENLDGFNWSLLRAETEKIMAIAARLGIWVILGSTHQLTTPNKPHNSLYLIDVDGKIADRYDKRFCTSGDLGHYTPGDRFVNFTVNGVKCSLLICFDLRFPELYRELKKQNVQCIFQSFYNARQTSPSVHTYIMRQTMQTRAATNYFWVSMTNSSGYYSPYPSCFITPDGKIAGQLRSNKAGMMINKVDTSKEFYDASADFREMAMAGKLNSGGETIEDQRSVDTERL